MNNFSKYLFLLTVLSVFISCEKNPGGPDKQEDPALVAACNYIEGGGGTATGGKDGAVYIVSTLSDSIDEAEGKAVMGTLRYALEQGDARLVLFRVAGTIHLQKPLTITRGNITIAGQSAPGDGICIADYPLIIKSCNNVIVRFLRFRLGNESLKKDKETDYDALSVNDTKNVVLDHLSCSWSVDECVSCYGNENFTMQYCFVTESLRNAGHVKGAHGYGGIWGGKNASFHHNLLAHHDSRNPRFDHDYVETACVTPVDFINNVVYNWGGNNTYGGESTTTTGNLRQYNVINNYYKPGPSSNSRRITQLINPTTKCPDNCVKKHGGEVVPGRFFLNGNYITSSESVSNDNWTGVNPDESNKKDLCKSATRFSFTNAFTNEQSAGEAYETVLAKAGCSLSRDAVDMRIVNEVRNGGGKLIDKPSDVGGWPTLSGERKTDTDGDGIPDEWEEAHGLNPRSYADGRAYTLVSGVSNLEVYLNAIVAHLY